MACLAGRGRIGPALLATLLLAPAPVFAQTTERPPAEGLDASGAVRLRYEAIGGQARAGFNSADELVNLRTQLKLSYRSGPVWVVAELFDSRVWGENNGTPLGTGEVNTVEPVQAYVGADLGAAFGRGTRATLQAGRFMLNVGSRRLIASDDYRNTTNGYTGLLLDVSAPGGFKASALYVLPQTRLPDDAAGLRSQRVRLDRESFDTVLWGGLASKPIATRPGSTPVTGEVSFFHFGERDSPGRPTRDRSLDNVGLRLFAEPKPARFDFGIDAIYQWGRTSASAATGAASLPVSASYFRGHIGYSFKAPWKPHLILSLDRASGDAPGGSYGRFDPLFGMRRAELGPAGLYNAIGRTNIFSPELRLEVAPGKRFDAFVGWRPMWLADSRDAFSTTGVRDASGQSGGFAGHQFELRARYWLVPQHLRAEFNAVVLAKGRFLRTAPNAPPDAATRYASFNLTAAF